MANLLCFSRNRCTSVEIVDESTIRAVCRLQDTLMDAEVALTVSLPDLEIMDVSGKVQRTVRQACTNLQNAALQKVVGVRIGPGVLKIIKGLIGEETDCKQVAFMVEECCHAVILSFTKEELLASPRPTQKDEAKDFYSKMVKDNIRLYNRCAAFSKGSSLVEGIEPPK